MEGSIDNNNKDFMNLKKFSLIKKTALITGASGLLGIEHAIALLSTGARIVLTDIDEKSLKLTKKKLIKTYNDKDIRIEMMDVTSIIQIEEICNKLNKDGWFIDILVNNAAIDPKVSNKINILESSRLENFSLEQWNLEIAVGLTGTFLCCKVFGSEMAKRDRGGVILNISSDLSVISPDQRLYRKDNLDVEMQPVKPITYSVIKTGIIGLTRYIATYWPEKNIRINSLSPGGVLNNQDQNFVDKVSKLIPLGRMANKNEYHSAIQFLCSDASLYMNGQNIVMDGGRSIW